MLVMNSKIPPNPGYSTGQVQNADDDKDDYSDEDDDQSQNQNNAVDDLNFKGALESLDMEHIVNRLRHSLPESHQILLSRAIKKNVDQRSPIYLEQLPSGQAD